MKASNQPAKGTKGKDEGKAKSGRPSPQDYILAGGWTGAAMQHPTCCTLGVISAVYPHTPTNRANLGLDIFSGYYRAPTLVALNTVLPKVSGPFKAEGDPRLYVTVSIPIYFTNVTPDTTWGIPHQPDCPVGLCYKHESKTKWWGTAAITLDVDVMFDPTGSNHILNQFSDSGLSWRLSSPTFGDSSTYNTVYESSSASMGCNNLCKSIPVVNDEWRLCVWKASWQPAYLVPLLVVLVLVALALSAATFTVLLSRHEHRALLHSLLPAKAIQRLQANYHWATKSVTGTMTVLLEAGTPAEMILSVMEDILLGRPPALPKVMAVRHTLQQSLDVYQPLQADLTQRMAETGNMDSEVREALMVQLMGRQVRDEPECDEGLDPGWQDSWGWAAASNLMAQDLHIATPCQSAFSWHHGNGKVSAVQERVLSLSSGQRPSPSRRAIATPHRLSYTGSRLHPFPVLPRLPSLPHMLAHIMARQQPERLPPGSGAALLAEPPSADHLQDSAPNWAGAAGLSQRSMGQHLLEDIMTSTASGVVVPSPRDVGGGAGFARHSANLVTLAPRPLREPPHIGLFHQVESCLSSANSWAFDAFQLTSATAGRPLSVLAYWLLHQSGLAAWAHLDHTKLARWLCRIEDGYCANPYHNRSHAADVVQTMHMLLTRGGLMPGYADHLTQLAAYLAAVCHDYQHIGRTNDWLVETQDELALRYNDRSPMENHHLAGAFSLLKHPDMNFLQAMPKATYDRLRKLMIELVLGTDMKQHFSIVGSFTAMHRSAPATTLHSAVKPSAVSLSPSVTTAEMSQLDQADTASRHSLVEETSRSLSPISDQDKLLSLQMALKCSDLGHLAAPLPVHLAWVSRLEAEFFAQGDAERAQGLTISPLCDRTKQGITKSQVGFFDFVALPLFNNFTARFTAAKPLLHGVTQNYRHWQAEAAVASAAGG
ncbi:hypothetical protein QJQ45_007397 [Haematococcus lacustris]|nr:hypothetical protein QJQ45_007397 [Haematococcus lacustris]